MAKYLPQSGVSHLWNKVKSLVATKADSSTAFKNGDAVMTTNPFGGRHLYINKIDNAFYLAATRWNVTAKIYDSETDEYESDLTPMANIFDGNYETQCQVPAGKYAVITMDFSGGKEGSGYFPGYPYGKMYMSFYFNNIPAEVTARGYCNYASQGIGWKNLPVSYLRGDDNSTSNVTLSIKNSYYAISKFEFTVRAKSDTTTKISQLEMDLDRPYPGRAPFLNKYSAESLYYNLTAPSFTGRLIGNADTATTATKLSTARTINVSNAATGAVASFDGSENVTIPVSSVKEAYLEWGGKDLKGSYSPLDGAFIQELSANRLACIPNGSITLERSPDNGTTWNTVTTTTGTDLCTTSSVEFNNGNTVSSQSVDNIYRVTIRVDGFLYCKLKKIALYINENGASGTTCLIETGDYSDTTVWTAMKEAQITGWTDWNIIQTDWVIGSPTNGNIKYIRLTFKQKSVNSTYNSSVILNKLRFYASSCWYSSSTWAMWGVPYTFSNKQIAFSNAVKSTNGFVGNLIGNADTATAANKLFVTTLSNSGRTIGGLQEQLDNWLQSRSNFNNISSCRVAMGPDFITAWNSGDTSATYGSGGYWTFQIIATYSSNTYTHLLISSYSAGEIYSVVKVNGVWGIIRKIVSNVDNIPISGSTNPIQSGWIYTNWQNKLDKTANAASAAKLLTASGNVVAGSSTQPVYFSGGLPQACTYTLGKSVPSNAEFAPEVSSEDNGKLMQVIGGAWQTSDFSFNDIFGLIGNQKYTVSNWMPNTSQTIASLSGVTAGTGAVLFEKSGGADYSGTFSVRTDGIDSSCVYSGIKPGEIKTVKFNSMPVFSYSASESSVNCAFTITLLYPPS